MVFSEKIKGFSNDLQMGAQKATHSLTHIILRLVSGLFIGAVLGLIIQELTQSGQLMLVFLVVAIAATLFKALSRFSMFQIFVFDLICVLIGTVLRMYILIAPN